MKPPRRLPLRVFLLAMIAACGIVVNITVNEKRYDAAVVAGLVAVVCSAIELSALQRPPDHIKGGRLSKRVFRKLASRRTRDAIRKRLGALHTDLLSDDETTMSMTVHLAVSRDDCLTCHTRCSLVQLLNYVGHRSEGEGRVYSDLKGIIGRCLRTREPQSVNFLDEQEYSMMMTREFGYYPNEISFHDTDGRSYLCSPIGQEGGVMAVLYLYSTKPGTFPNKVADYTSINEVRAACMDISHVLAGDRLVGEATP